MKYGEKLRYYRESKEISVYRLSQVSGISQGHISDLENGVNQPTIDTLKRLLAPLSITLAEFFNDNGETAILIDREKALVANFRTLPDDKADLYLQLGKALNNN